jgi:hypothetical protein
MVSAKAPRPGSGMLVACSWMVASSPPMNSVTTLGSFTTETVPAAKGSIAALPRMNSVVHDASSARERAPAPSRATDGRAKAVHPDKAGLRDARCL